MSARSAIRSGEHFLRSTLIQTLFYDVFPAWMPWTREHPPMNRKALGLGNAGYHLPVPILAEPLHQASNPLPSPESSFRMFSIGRELIVRGPLRADWGGGHFTAH